MGYCTTGWWLSQKFCCAEVSEEGEACAEWRNWGGIEPFRYMAYIFFAVSSRSATTMRFTLIVLPGSVLLFRSQTRQIVRPICSRIWYLGNQVYHWRFHHQRLPELLDTGNQKLDACRFHLDKLRILLIAASAAGDRFRTFCRQRGTIRARRLLCRKRDWTNVQKIPWISE